MSINNILCDFKRAFVVEKAETKQNKTKNNECGSSCNRRNKFDKKARAELSLNMKDIFPVAMNFIFYLTSQKCYL